MGIEFTPKARTEQEIKNAIFNYLKAYSNITVWNNKNTGTARFNKKTKKLFYTKSPNSKLGISDIIGFTDKGRFVAIEVKNRAGMRIFEREYNGYGTTAFYEQRFLDAVNNAGGISLITDSLDDFINQWSKITI